MNPRERTLLIALVAIVGGFLALYGAKRLWWDPLQETNKLIATITDENDALQTQWDQFEKDRKKLPIARVKSLPLSQYRTFLNSLLGSSGLSELKISEPSTSGTKLVTPIPNVKEPGHQVLTFTVGAKGELAEVVKVMEKFYKAPHEHRIRNITLDRADMAMKKGASSKLNVTMIIEALLVAKGDGKTASQDDPKLLAMAMPEGRKYADLPKKNIFVGYVPPPPKKVVEEKPEVEIDDRQPAPEEDTPSYVRLTTTFPEQQLAYFRNLIYQQPEMKRGVNTPGFQEFQVTDEFGNYVFFRAKLTRVEQRRVFFQIGRSNDGRFTSHKVYTVEIGQSLADAKNYSENRARIDLIDEELFDEEFEKSEKAKDEAATKKKTKDNKGKTTKKGGKMGS